jgi:hypothetical protein
MTKTGLEDRSTEDLRAMQQEVEWAMQERELEAHEFKLWDAVNVELARRDGVK